MDPTSHEKRLVEGVERDLHDEFPQVSPDQITALVEFIWAHYDGARIRDFVPQLVRKQAREELLHDVSTQPAPQPAPQPTPQGTALATSSRARPRQWDPMATVAGT